MPAKTKVIALNHTRVRIEVEVSSEEVESALARHAEGLGQGRILAHPAFSEGKPPGPVVIERMGRDMVLGLTVRRQLPRWYEEAILEADLKTVGHPRLHMAPDLPELGDPFMFSIAVSVKPKARLGTYKGLKVVRREPEAVVDAAVKAATVELPDELVTARAEEIWERFESELSDRGTDTKTYLDDAGKTFEQAIDDAKPEAARQLQRESVLEAIAEAEGIDVADEHLRQRMVIDLLVEHAIPAA